MHLPRHPPTRPQLIRRIRTHKSRTRQIHPTHSIPPRPRRFPPSQKRSRSPCRYPPKRPTPRPHVDRAYQSQFQTIISEKTQITRQDPSQLRHAQSRRQMQRTRYHRLSDTREGLCTRYADSSDDDQVDQSTGYYSVGHRLLSRSRLVLNFCLCRSHTTRVDVPFALS